MEDETFVWRPMSVDVLLLRAYTWEMRSERFFNKGHKRIAKICWDHAFKLRVKALDQHVIEL